MGNKYDEVIEEIQSRLDDERLKSGESSLPSADWPKNSTAASTLY